MNVQVCFNQCCVSFHLSYTKMVKKVMHLLEDSFDKGLWDAGGFLCTPCHSPCLCGTTSLCHHTHMNPFQETTSGIFHQFGNSDAMLIKHGIKFFVAMQTVAKLSCQLI